MAIKAPELKNNQYTLDDLVDVMRALRNPDGGCPWDLEQDFSTIVPHTIEEAYEVADAIERGDMKDLREELGDLLFQSVYHAQMASENGDFDIRDVMHDLTAKMIFRHPHVFGDEDARDASDVNVIWDQQKDQEKEQKGALSGVALALPSLLRAQKLQKRAARVGFEWPDLHRVLDKLEEEIAELRVAIDNDDLQNQEEELGDVLFVLVNFARMQGINAEESLRKCNSKFISRFNGLEDILKKKYKDISEASLEEMSEAWTAQKEREKAA